MRIALAAVPVREGTRPTGFTAPLPREIEAAPNYDTIRARPAAESRRLWALHGAYLPSISFIEPHLVVSTSRVLSSIEWRL